jgi:hypothetical protein
MVDVNTTTEKPQFFGLSRQQTSNWSLIVFLAGGVLVGLGLWARFRYKKMLNYIHELIQCREIWVMRQMEAGPGGRMAVGRLMRLAFQLKDARDFVGGLR